MTEEEISGRVASITLPAAGAHPVLRIDLRTEEGRDVELVFVGLSRLPGLAIGRAMSATGRIFVGGAHYQMFNPKYALRAEAP